MPICPSCGNQTAENAVFCDQCGTRMPEPEPVVETVAAETTAGSVPDGVLTCPDCGAENVPGVLFCDECGSPLEPPAPVVAEEPAAYEAEPVVEAEPIVEAPLEAAPLIEPEPVVEPEPIIEPEPIVEPEPLAEPEPIAEAVPAPAAVTQVDVYCPTCGATVEVGESFCGNCGASLDAAAPEPEIVPEEPILDESPLPAVPLEEEAEVLIEEVVIEEPAVEAAPAADESNCPVCGANVLPDQAFCAGCGAALQPTAAAEAAPAVAPAAAVIEPEPIVTPEPLAPAPAAPPAVAPAAGNGPYLEIADSGAHIPLVDQPKLSIGRLDEISGVYPDIDLTPHGGDEAGVSRRHAELTHEGVAWYVLDLDSTNGTFVNGVELTPKTRSLLSDGDQIMMGELQLVFHAH